MASKRCILHRTKLIYCCPKDLINDFSQPIELFFYLATTIFVH